MEYPYECSGKLLPGSMPIHCLAYRKFIAANQSRFRPMENENRLMRFVKLGKNQELKALCA